MISKIEKMGRNCKDYGDGWVKQGRDKIKDQIANSKNTKERAKTVFELQSGSSTFPM